MLVDRVREVRVEVTGDGSLTIADLVTGSTYHSRHGAKAESLHVFIGAGLQPMLDKGLERLNILEMGFGTGLNALLTARHVCELTVQVHYTALECYPLGQRVWEELALRENDLPEMLRDLHGSPWNTECSITPNFRLTKREERLQDFVPPEAYDLIYYDAFEPGTQPELWTEEIFRKLFGMTSPGGMLVTYCAKGSVRRAMQAAGYAVERLPGPPFKREMLRAVRLSG
jgi:tRNA U34 5-methylaminomethyl-2-thiouridine-forming methyltransferase MnmC